MSSRNSQVSHGSASSPLSPQASLTRAQTPEYPLAVVTNIALWSPRARLRRVCEQHASLLKVTDAALDKLIQVPKLNELMLKLKDEAHQLFLLYAAYSNVGPAKGKIDVGDTEYVNVRRILDEEPGIKFRVDEAILKKYYRRLSRRYHPDVGTKPDSTRFNLVHSAYKAQDVQTLYLMLNSSAYELTFEEENEMLLNMIKHMEGVVGTFRGGVSFSIAACYVAGGKIKAQNDLENAIRRKIRACQLARIHDNRNEAHEQRTEEAFS